MCQVLLEENTEQVILRWKTSQKSVYRVNSDEELEWELERTAVSCKALLDSKIEELYGASDVSGGAAAQRRKELREREQKRVDRARKRKMWREAEFARELDRLQSSEKRLREEERLRDDVDREKQEQEAQEKQRKELKLEKLEADDGLVRTLNVAQLADNRALMQMVEK
ncbi:RBM25, partial [Symbiodinium pilosum]